MEAASRRERTFAPVSGLSAMLARVAIVALAYFLGAKLGLRLAFDNENVTSVWPPTGIAVAALLLFGRGVWPGIAVGALAANLTNGASVPTSLGITIGNTLAPVVAASLLRSVGFRPELDRMRDVVALVFVGGAASMLVSATGGTTALAANGAIERGTYGSTWLVWWIGDALGVVIFAPLLLTLLAPTVDLSSFRSRPREATVLFVAATTAASLVFSSDVLLPYLVFPFAIWAALRFYQQGAASLTVLVAVVAIVQTAAHNGPFSTMSRTTNLVSLQLFNATLAMISLSLAAVTRERIGESEKARRLRLLDEFKDSLLTAVSHELRTPLTVIVGLSSTLKNRELDLTPEEVSEALTRLEANAHRLESLLMDMLDLDRLNRRVIEPHPSPVEMRECVLRVLDTLEVPNRPVEVDLGSASVSVDPAHLERIVENLVANAVRHTPPGTPIWIRADRTSEGVVLVVEDAGPGVPVALRTEIFEPFRRGNTNSHSPGTGVGLSLVHRFAGLNGGRAWVEDREGGGASFRVLLPAGSASGARTASERAG